MIITIRGVRFIVATLAAFASFFAYICRFNLSLAIIAMVKPQLSTTSEMLKSIASIDGIGPEEQMLAWLPPQKYYYPRLIKNKTTDTTGVVYSHAPYNVTIRLNKTKNYRDNDVMKINTSALNRNQPTPDIEEDTIRILPHHIEPVLLDWTDENKDSILGAFFYGYVLAQIPATRCAEIWGAKWLYVASGLGSGLVTLIFPWVAENTPVASVFLARFTMGILQSGVFPASYVLLNDWLPPNERSKWLPIPSAASRVGMIVISMLCNFIIIRYNWQAVFYLSAVATLTWTVIWLIVGSSRPRDNIFISRKELLFIESSLRSTRTELKEPNLGNLKKVYKRPVDWMKLITSQSIWLMTLVMFASEWSNMLLFLLMPRFFSGPLKFDLGESGFWSSVIVLVFCINLPFTGYLSTKMIEHKFMNMTILQVRKSFEFFALMTQATGCLMLVFFTGKVTVLAALFTIIIGRSSIGGGQCQLPSELSKEHSGTVFAFGNTVSNMACFVGPALFTYIVMSDYTDNFAAWNYLWLLSSFIFGTCGFIFVLFGDNRCQDFSKTTIDTNSSRLSLGKHEFSPTTNPYIVPNTSVKSIAEKDHKPDLGADNQKHIEIPLDDKPTES